MKLYDLAKQIKGQCHGDRDIEITGLGTIQSAGRNEITFLSSNGSREALKDCNASAVILNSECLPAWGSAAIVCDDPHLGYARAARLLCPNQERAIEIHQSAIISEKSIICANVSIGANCVIQDNVYIGESVHIGPGSIVEEGVVIGKDTRIFSNVTLCREVSIGKRCFVKSGAVLGSDGFGNTNENGKWVRIPQLGSLQIGDDVQIGAATTIDRGAIGDTVVESGVVIDNLVQIGHNCRIGADSAIVSCVGIAGSVTIGKRCILAGAVGVADHVSICDDVHLTGMAMVTGSIDKPGMYSSGTGLLESTEWRKAAVRFRQLDALVKRVQTLEKKYSNS